MTSRRGQSLVLFALCLLLVTLMVCMTLSIGSAAARRADLNHVADAAALSNAVATARTFNLSALLNRAMVAHYVAQGGIQAQMSYATRGQRYLFEAGYHLRLYDVPASAGPITDYGQIEAVGSMTLGCGARTNETRAASYELWHRAYAFYRWSSGAGPFAGDNVNSACASSGTCSTPQSWITPKGVAQAEEDAAAQARMVHDAIWDLAIIQRRTLLELEQKVRTDRYAKQIADAAKLPAGHTYDGRKQALAELQRSTGSTNDFSQTRDPDGSSFSTWRRPMGLAVMGSRPRRALVLPTRPEFLAPLIVKAQAIATAGLASTDLAGKFTVALGPGDTSFEVRDSPEDASDAALREEALGPATAGMKVLLGKFEKGSIATTYADSCAGGTVRRTQNGALLRDPISGLRMDLKETRDYIVVKTNTAIHSDPMHTKMEGGGCHGQHEHYGAIPPDVHSLGNDVPLLPVEALGYVLPDQSVASGARGAWGQPKLPLMISRRGAGASDPFNLTVRMRPGGAELDLTQPIDTQVAATAGIAYYHRRGHLGEPPNVLNPFWHAALVPIEIDERSTRDPTENSQGGVAMDAMIQGLTGYQGERDARKAYSRLSPFIDGMEKSPRAD